MSSPDLSVIIVNWNSATFTKQCLASIFANAGALNIEVIVVDNASYDGCAEMVGVEFPDVTFVQSQRNLGFSGANNLALGRASGRNVLFLNPDTEIEGSALQVLLSAVDSIPDAGMVGARLLNSDLSLQTTCITALPSILNQALSCDYLRKTFPRWHIWGMRPLFENHPLPIPVEAISGACMMAKRAIVEQVGGFTTDYFMYSEDMDLCLKVAKTGQKIYYVPAARIIHHAAGSSSSRKESHFSTIMLRESVTRFMTLHRGPAYSALYRMTTGGVALFRLLLLAVACPIAVTPRGFRFLSRACTKWYEVFTWSLGLKHWANEQ